MVVVGAVVLVFLSVLLFGVLDDFLGVPLTVGVFVLVYGLFFAIVYWERILATLWPRKYAHRAAVAAAEVPVEGPEAPIPSRAAFADLVEPCLESKDPAIARTAEILREARESLYDSLTACLDDGQPVQIVREDFGTVSVRTALKQGHSFLYLHEHIDISTARDLETLACSWKLRTDQRGRADVLLTVDTEWDPQLLLKPGHHRFPATPAGWRELVTQLSR